ncbi:MAG TPA: MmcQ/YjbR family DNA-binding protein [Acidimicrobiales bacterium]
MSDYADAPAEIVDRLRPICLALPEAHEEKAWAGTRWCIRKRNFAHVMGVEAERPKVVAENAGVAGRDGLTVILTFRSAGEELDVLRATGHPFFPTRWNPNVLGMVLDDATDWDEVAELLTESYCLLAPKKLVALVDRPEPVDSDD